jgi:flagellar hook assembly protein FlgD
METTFSSSTGRTEFMQLLVAQLKNQDPLEPVPQHEFLAQLAQFSTLEGIENLNSNFAAVLDSQLEAQDAQTTGMQQLNTNIASMLQLQQVEQGASLIGKHVIYTDPDDTPEKTSTGELKEPERYTSENVVSQIELKDGTLQLRIGEDQYIPMGHVFGVVGALSTPNED